MDVTEQFGPKLAVSVVHCTARTRGWHSAKSCEYPQEIIFRFDGCVDITALRFLAHEHKIPAKVDIYVHRPGQDELSAQEFPNCPPENLDFQRLGFISFSNNEGSNFNARELRTARIRTQADHIKLVIRKCHTNHLNVFNQVGFIAVNFHGDCVVPYRIPRAADGDGRRSMHNFGEHLPGSQADVLSGGLDRFEEEVPLAHLTPQKAPSNPLVKAGAGAEAAAEADLSNRYDPVTAKQIKELSLHKARAVKEEDYDLAKVLRDQITELKRVGEQIADLEEKKQAAVEQEDYDHAKILKRQIDQLRNPKPSLPVPVPQNQVPHPFSQQQQQQPDHMQANNFNDQQQYQDQQQQQQQYNPPSNNRYGNDDQPVAARGTWQVDESVGADSAPPGAQMPPPLPHQQQQQPDQQYNQQDQQYHNQQQQQLEPSSYGNDEQAAVGTGAIDNESGGIVAVAKPTLPPGQQGADPNAASEQWEKKIGQIAQKTAGDQAPAELLPQAKQKEHAGLIQVFGLYVTCAFFSKRWQVREAAVRACTSREGFAALTNGVRPPNQGSPNTVAGTLLAYLAMKGYGVLETIPQAFFASCDTVKRIINEELEGVSTATQGSAIFTLLPDLMTKAGDGNQRVREHASATLMIIATSSLGAERVSGAALYDPQKDSKKPVAHRVQSARLSLVAVLLDKVGLQRKDKRTGLTPEAIMKSLCVPLLTHTSGDVREAAVQLVVKLHGLVPSSLMERLLADVKPAQRSIIDEQLAAAGNNGGTSPRGGNQNQHHKEEEIVASSFTVERGGAAVLQAAREVNKEQKQQQQQAKKPAEKPAQQQQQQPAQQAPPKSTASPQPNDAEREAKTCQFCGRYSPDFNDEALDQHYITECPMLCPCALCGSVTEIALLQDHLIGECDKHALVKQCPNCREAVPVGELQAHVAAESCIPYKPAEYNVCPLCHMRIAPGDRGWDDHLLKAPGCSKNPRPIHVQ